MKDFANIPIELCTYVLREHKTSQLRLYVYLKTVTEGKIILNNSIINGICSDLSYKSDKTFRTHFNWLVANQWLISNSITGIYTVISYERLAELLNFKSAKGAIYEPLDFKNFKAFIISVVITNYMKKKRSSDKRREREKGRSSKLRIPTSLSYNLPLSYLAKVLGVTKTAARDLVKLAAKSPWLTVKSSYTKLELSLDEKDFIKEYSDLEVNKIVVRKKQLCLQNPNIIISYVHFRRKRPIRKKLSEKEKNFTVI